MEICFMCVLEERHVGRQKTQLIGKDVTPLVVKRPFNIIIITQHIQSSRRRPPLKFCMMPRKCKRGSCSPSHFFPPSPPAPSSISEQQAARAKPSSTIK